MMWRVLFLAGGALILAGGPRHPQGTMAQMLAHPDWFIAHALMTAGFAAMLAGLVMLSRQPAQSDRMRRWTRYAAIATALQTFESVMHTASMVDGANLAAGASTPVLTTHLFLAVTLYPVFAAGMIGFIIAGMRERAVGSVWIGWLGILGLTAHGLSAPLVVGLGIGQAGILFPMLMGLALWLVLAAVWPARARVRAPAIPQV